MRYFLPKDHFPRVGCIRCLATEQRLKLNSDKSFLLITLLYSAVIYDKYTRMALDSDNIVFCILELPIHLGGTAS